MTSEERKEFNNMICGTALCARQCYSYREGVSYLVYDGIFRCSIRGGCYRVQPKLGRLSRNASYEWGGYNSNGTWNGRQRKDEFKVALINRKIKAYKNDLTAPKLKLIKQDKKIMVEVEGQTIPPRFFSQSWWYLQFERDF